MTPTVSVIIPTFNRSTLLPNAIESVLAQTYTDYELIVIDDGSTDDTREKLKPYMGRIKYFYQENRGASAAQNRGIQVARGKWVSILASDDLWLPTKLERQFNALATLGNEFGACYTNCTLVGKNPDMSRTVFEQADFKTGLECAPDDHPLACICGNPVIWVQSLLVLRSLMIELNGFDEALVVHEDTDLLLRMASKTRFCFVSAPLVQINQDASIQHLSELAFQRNERQYVHDEYLYRKWIGLPGLVDPRLRRVIQDNLRRLYYSWAAAKLYQMRVSSALRKLNEVRAMGDSYATIAGTFLCRGARKLIRSLFVRSGSVGLPAVS